MSDKNYPINGETDRLIVRPSEGNDYLEWTAFFEDSDSVKYFPNPEFLTPVELAKRWVSSHILNYRVGLYGQMALIDKADGKLVGSAGFLLCELNGKAEVQTGVAILPLYQKRYYALEALEYLNKIAGEYGICSLISVVHKDNIASQRLTIKAGKKFEKEIIYEGCPAYLYRKSF